MRLLFILLTLACMLTLLFYPKRVGGPLCGPECLPKGLHYWSVECLGIRKRYSCSMSIIDFIKDFLGLERKICTDTFADYCFGIPVGEKKCYGVPYLGSGNVDVQLDCNYPCSDSKIKELCRSGYDNESEIPCDWIKEKCGW